MSLTFTPNQVLAQNDLNMMIFGAGNLLVDPVSIGYDLYRVDRVGLVPLQAGTPTRYSLGWFYAPLTIQEEWPDGEYQITFRIVQNSGDPEHPVIIRFFIYKTPILAGSFDAKVFQLISKLRIVLRDNNPDKNYHFRPPRHVEEVNAYTQRIGYIWEDAELATYLDLGLGMINGAPPLTGYRPENLPEGYEASLLYAAASAALEAMATNWVEEEFGYNLSGQSLDLQKSQKYQGLADGYDTKFDKLLDRAKKAHEKYARGIRQPQYTVSIQGFTGPFLSRNTLSARTYLEAGASF